MENKKLFVVHVSTGIDKTPDSVRTVYDYAKSLNIDTVNSLIVTEEAVKDEIWIMEALTYLRSIKTNEYEIIISVPALDNYLHAKDFINEIKRMFPFIKIFSDKKHYEDYHLNVIIDISEYDKLDLAKYEIFKDMFVTVIYIKNKKSLDVDNLPNVLNTKEFMFVYKDDAILDKYKKKLKKLRKACYKINVHQLLY